MCDKAFRHTNSQKVHEPVDTGEHPYCYDLCNKTFSDRGNLRVHQHAHTGERPFYYDIRNKTFSGTSSLKVRHSLWTGSIQITVICVTKYSANCSMYSYINLFILVGVHLPVMRVIKLSLTEVI